MRFWKTFKHGWPDILIVSLLIVTLFGVLWTLLDAFSLHRELVQWRPLHDMESSTTTGQGSASAVFEADRGAVWLRDTARIRGFLGTVALLIVVLSSLTAALFWRLTRTTFKFSRAAAIRRESHDRYRFLAEGPPSIGIVRLALSQGRLADANRAALSLLGKTRSASIDHPVEKFVLAEDHEVLGRELGKLKAGRKGAEFTVRMEGTAGAIRDISWHVSVLRQPGSGLEAIAILTDVTEKLKAESERLEKERLAGVLEMAGAAAHELNQPLQVALGYAWMLLQKKELPDSCHASLEKLHHEIERMSQIGQKISMISEYKVKSYVGRTKIVDIDQATSHGKRIGGRSDSPD
jgi:PAS domain S-box-containing protein